MSDATINRFLARGTTAQRTAFTPSAPTPSSGPSQGYLWWDTDLQAEYAYDFGLAAWVATSSGGSGTVTHTGTLTSGQLIKGNGGVDVTVTDLTGDVTTSGGVATTLKTAAKTRAITFTIDGGGSVPATGVKGDISVPYACTITGARMLADQSGSAVVNVWKDTYANYPPTVADKITASAPPTITTATKSDDTTLSGWTTSISAGDTLRFNLDSITTITRVVLILTVTV
jgi:hypothetical protein